MRRRWRSIAFLAVLLTAWAVIEVFGLNAPELRSASGVDIVVRDGDTLRIGGADVRLDGIDAPEYLQICKDGGAKDWPCGKAARTALAKLVADRTIMCETRARDEYGRSVAICRDERGTDLGAAMAAQGLAISPGWFGDGPYGGEANAAKEAKRGIWAGQFDLPVDWRAKHLRETAVPLAPKD